MDAHKNLAYSVVAGAPSPATSGTSLTVSAGHGVRFPTPPFNAVVWATGAIPTPANAEIVRVTNIVTDTLTIDREEESTTARTIIIGDQIAAAITAKTLTDIEALLDHGALPGLTDDDHTQYLKERASGGLESEVPGHDHTATAKAGVLTRTRSLYIPANAFGLGTGAALAAVGNNANAYDRLTAWAFDPSSDEYVITSAMLPSEWAAGAVTAKIHWAPSTTNNGSVRWDVGFSDIASTDQIDEARTYPTVTQAASGTAEARHVATCTTTFTPTQAFLGLTVYRSAANGSDTFTGDAWFLGLELEFSVTL
jgi:hypothetical protein